MGVRSLSRSFARVQRAEGRSPKTVVLYGVCVTRLVAFAEAEAGSDDVGVFTRRLLTDFYATRLATVAPATVSVDFRVHRVFFRWLVDEGELSVSPMDRMKQPRVPVTPVPVLSEVRPGRLEACLELGVEHLVVGAQGRVSDLFARGGIGRHVAETLVDGRGIGRLRSV